MRNLFYSIKHLFRSVKRLFYWLPVIWHDRDWDEHFFFIILRHKLKSMEKYFSKNAHFLGMEKEAKRMEICIMLLDRLIAEEYMDIAFKEHEKKWGDFVWESDNLHRTKVTPETKDREWIEAKHCYELEDYLRQQDISHFCKTISKYVHGWWD